MKMIVGLGNPGVRYEGTRHNIGFSSIDRLKLRIAPNKEWRKNGDTLLCEVDLSSTRLYLLKPQSFMNLSGKPVAVIQRFYKVSVGDIVVIHDDVDLSFGRIQIKLGGGDAGHNGLKSLRAELGSGDFCRVRCGVGRPPVHGEHGEEAMVQWVLGRFTGADAETADKLASEAAEASLLVCEQGIAVAQREYNRRAL